MTPYEKGREREYKAKALMESWFGCAVVRSAGSHTPIDLVCGNGMNVYAVQVKSESDADTVNWYTLRQWAEYFQAIPTLLVYCTGGRWKVYFDGERYSQENPYLGTW
jgi:Holliday junction resolvase